jgi:lipoprotein-anchoring transpeptidase ErfK/SrfK
MNLPGDFLDRYLSRGIREGAMFRKAHHLGLLTGLIAAAALTSGTASAQQAYAYLPPQPLFQQAVPPQILEPQEPQLPQVGDENAELPPDLQRQIVDYRTKEAPGTIIVDTPNTFLYYVLGDGKAIRYGVGVGREGFTWSGVKHVARKQEWPDWFPPPEMIDRQPYLPRMMAGGPGNPLGARALYIAGTQYRIHGTNNPASIGHHVSSGCIRMTNDNAIDLYNRVKVGAKVLVLPQNRPITRQARAEQDEAVVPMAAVEQLPAAPRAHTSWNVFRASGVY